MTPERYDLSCVVDSYRDGWRLGDFLAHRFRYYSPEIWAERLAAGTVRVNGSLAAADLAVRRGDRVEYVLFHTEPSVDFAHAVVYEDEHLLAVSKSGNLPVHAGGIYIRNTLIAKLRESYGSELRLAHRLDRETSGVVLLAKSREIAVLLEREFHAQRVHKEYAAILCGEAPAETIVDAPIARRDPKGGSSLRVVDHDRGKASRTTFRRIALQAGTDTAPALSFVRATPESGRTNQIRVHARHMGHPVLGDKNYGVPDVAVPRHLLHCARLGFHYPGQARWLVLEAPVPADFQESWGGLLPPFSVSSAELRPDPAD